MGITVIAFLCLWYYYFLVPVSIRLSAYNYSWFIICFSPYLNGKETIDMDYISTQQAAEKWGISNRRGSAIMRTGAHYRCDSIQPCLGNSQGCAKAERPAFETE